MQYKPSDESLKIETKRAYRPVRVKPNLNGKDKNTMRRFAYCIIDSDGVYSLDEAFYSAEDAIKALNSGDDVALLDECSFEYLGTLELH